MIVLGEKIRMLRRQREISQETLANSLGISFQAVSKWETGASMPDVALIPAIASFFGVSIDELFDFNVYTVEKNVEAIVSEHCRYRNTDPARSEQLLRDGLKKYPGNDVLLNCLIEVIPVPERSGEVIGLCKMLIEGTRCAEIKYDACRILAEAYRSVGEYSLMKEAIEMIPEIYFSKLGVAAMLMEGEEMLSAAARHKGVVLDDLIGMCERMADYYDAHGEPDRARIQLEIARDVLLAFGKDFATPYTRKPSEAFKENLDRILERLAG